MCVCVCVCVVCVCVCVLCVCVWCVFFHQQSDIASGCQVTHSEYLQSLVALVVGLDLHRALLLPLHPTHLPPDPVPADWQWLGTLSSAIAMAQSLTKRLPFPTNAGLPCIQGLDPDDPYQPTVGLPEALLWWGVPWCFIMSC